MLDIATSTPSSLLPRIDAKPETVRAEQTITPPAAREDSVVLDASQNGNNDSPQPSLLSQFIDPSKPRENPENLQDIAGFRRVLVLFNAPPYTPIPVVDTGANTNLVS